jgi:hypothetical protein
LIGAGFKSFWIGDRMTTLWVDLPGIVQAHNGYIETYLEGGFLGVLLLVAMFLAAFRTIKRLVLEGNDYARLRFSFLVVALTYNFSEAAVTQRTLVWLTTLLVLMQAPPATAAPARALVRQLSRRRVGNSAPGRVAAARQVGQGLTARWMESSARSAAATRPPVRRRWILSQAGGTPASQECKPSNGIGNAVNLRWPHRKRV